MGDFCFDRQGRLLKPTPCKWYEVVGMIVLGKVIGMLIAKFLLDKCL